MADQPNLTVLPGGKGRTTSDTEPVPGTIDWWNAESEVGMTQAQENLELISNAIATGNTDDPEVRKLAGLLVTNLPNDLDLHRSALARSNVERVSTMQGFIDWVDQQVMRWHLVRPLPPELLIKYRDSLQKSLSHATAQVVSEADAARSGMRQDALRSTTTIEIKVTDEVRRERESSSILRGLMDGIDRRLKLAAQQGVETIVSSAVIEVEQQEDDGVFEVVEDEVVESNGTAGSE